MTDFNQDLTAEGEESAGGIKMMKDFLGRGGLWVLGQHVLTLAVLALGPMLRGRSWPMGWLLLGGVLFFVGAVFGVAGVRALGRSRTPYPRPIDAAPLVISGIYRVVRHPLYASLMWLGLGWSLLWSSGPALAASVALTGLLDAKARLEERWLRARFPEYAEYARRVRRFVPGVY